MTLYPFERMANLGDDEMADTMEDLRGALGALLKIIPEGSKIALVDEPVHRNIGDHLIQSGSLAFFRQHGMTITYRASVWDYHSRNARRQISADTIIACQGEGHLGDLYSHHQRFRERVVRDFPCNRVVILPQSLYFVAVENEMRAVEVFGGHPDLHLCVRDEVSLKRALHWSCCPVHLVPDMAHALWPLSRAAEPSRMCADTLYLIRRDTERLPLRGAISKQREHFLDWLDLVRSRDTVRLGLIAAMLAASRFLPPLTGARRLLDRETQRLIRRAVAVMGTYQQVVTSRLHGMLLALLLKKPVKVLDSLTGKTSAYHSTWLSGIEECRLIG